MTENPVPKSVRRKQCLKEMADILRLISPWAINKLELSKKYDFEWKTIDRWHKNLLKLIPPEEIATLKIMAESSLNKNMEISDKIKNNPSLKEGIRLQAIRESNNTIERITKFLQDIGRLEKVPDELKHSGGIIIQAPDWWMKKKDANSSK